MSGIEERFSFRNNRKEEFAAALAKLDLEAQESERLSFVMGIRLAVLCQEEMVKLLRVGRHTERDEELACRAAIARYFSDSFEFQTMSLYEVLNSELVTREQKRQVVTAIKNAYPGCGEIAESFPNSVDELSGTIKRLYPEDTDPVHAFVNAIVPQIGDKHPLKKYHYTAAETFSDEAVPIGKACKYWGAARDFLKVCWVHDGDHLHRALFEVLVKQEKPGLDSKAESLKNRAGGPQKKAYQMADDWLARMQLRLKMRPSLAIADVAERSFQEAYNKSGSESSRAVRKMATDYLTKMISDPATKEAFRTWSNTHTEAERNMVPDPTCPETDLPGKWSEMYHARRAKPSNLSGGGVGG